MSLIHVLFERDTITRGCAIQYVYEDASCQAPNSERLHLHDISLRSGLNSDPMRINLCCQARCTPPADLRAFPMGKPAPQ